MAQAKTPRGIPVAFVFVLRGVAQVAALGDLCALAQEVRYGATLDDRTSSDSATPEGSKPLTGAACESSGPDRCQPSNFAPFVVELWLSGIGIAAGRRGQSRSSTDVSDAHTSRGEDRHGFVDRSGTR